MNPTSTPISHQQPADRPLRVVLLSAVERPDVLAEARRLRPQIEQYAQIVATDFHGAEDLSPARRRRGRRAGRRWLDPAGGPPDGRSAVARHCRESGETGVSGGCVARRIARRARAISSPASSPIIEHLMFECRVIRGGEVLCQKDRPERDRHPQRAAVFRCWTLISTLTRNW